MKLSIIVVNWNSTEYLRKAIVSIYENTTSLQFEVIVVDNASPADDVDIIADEFPAVTLIKNVRNMGFAGANNVGFRNSSGDYLLFLNPDTELRTPAINTMVAEMDKVASCGVVGCRLLNHDLSSQSSCIQTFPTIINQVLDVEVLRLRWPNCPLWRLGPLFSEMAEPAKVDVISGACMMIRREVFEAVGMFSENYFMYAEDLDLCHKVVTAGYTNWFVGSAAIVHYGGQSSPMAWATPAKWKAIIRYFVKHKGRMYAFAFRAVMVVVAVLRLTILVPAEVVGRSFGGKKHSYSSAQKWFAILKTLLRETGEPDGRVPVPPPGAPKDTATTQSSEFQSRGSSER